MSYSAGYSNLLPMSFASLEYRDVSDSPDAGELFQSEDGQPPAGAGKRRAEIEMSEEEFAARIRLERADATAQADQKLRQEYEQKLMAARAPIAATVKEFAEQREDYFTRVETEVVQLALSIAAKILHREAQVDPMLVATLVRIEVEKMQENSTIRIHVAEGRSPAWKQYFAALPNLGHVEIVEDAKLAVHDCLLETELGSANLGLEAQLKEVEKGFFDLLALRPATR